MTMQNKRITRIFLAVAMLLAVPLLGTLFTDSVNWGLFDFILAGVLLLGTGLLWELVARKVRKAEYRIALCAAILVALLLIWIELAVGLFGTPFAGS
ncbi:hypothetical protein [Pontibacter litorisediminis]|uniref:hypothetical protein n=1 Tax=Pontibacter litorisediminis TaxID=1846260 RepID=UPI0023ED65F8|nr:hypothetical protein [Pontibacter litorisediminis]